MGSLWPWSNAVATTSASSWERMPLAIRKQAERIATTARSLVCLDTADFAAACTRFAKARPIDTVVQREALLGHAAAAIQRVLGLEPYPTQLHAALQLLNGSICEMATGEGKSMASALAAMAFGLNGRHVHVVTVNEYLAARDQAYFAPVFAHCGLRCTVLPAAPDPVAKRRAYTANVVYGVGHDFGFDFLRDALAAGPGTSTMLGARWLARVRGEAGTGPTPLQPERDVALIDEADSVLIDEARSALILSSGNGQPAADDRPWRWAEALVATLQEDRDFHCPPGGANPLLTADGLARLAPLVPAGLPLARPWPRYVEQALRAHRVLNGEVDYLVGDGEILLIDEATGRALPGRAWNEGLQQAVQAREGLTITEESRPLLAIARQRFFQRYRTLCGLTGTATGLEREFRNFYGVAVVPVPLQRPGRRSRLPSRFFRSADDRLAAVSEAASDLHRGGRPVLIGTRTISDSERLGSYLRARGIDCQVLNARHDEAEADIVARAGLPGAVTVATNMAGRGTDIRLSEAVITLGGLHVIGLEHSEENRLDRQLEGRAGRQGDPGSAQFFVAAGDGLLRFHAPGVNRRLEACASAECTDLPPGVITTAQGKAASTHRRLRQRLYDADRERQAVLAALQSPQGA